MTGGPWSRDSSARTLPKLTTHEPPDAIPGRWGLGYVGDDNEPATRDQVEPEDVHPMTATPAWDQPGGDRASECPQCLGTGRVISLGGDVRGGRPTQMIQTTCPSCNGKAD